MKMKPLARFYTVLVMVFLFAPIAILLVFSFNQSKSLSVFSGFSLYWYRELFRDSNTRYLSAEEISGLSLQMLCYARNEIYARRGYIFRSQELRDYFGSKSWYYGTIPAASFSGIRRSGEFA